jgi:hypothetical protein
MPMLTKDVTINERTYQIGRISAIDGAWILGRWTEKWAHARAQMITQGVTSGQPDPQWNPEAAAKAPTPKREDATLAMAAFLIPKLSRAELAEIQPLCLSRCSRYEEAAGRQMPMPIMTPNGTWAVAELEYDGPTVMRLLQESIAFNIAPYFPEPGSIEQK